MKKMIRSLCVVLALAMVAVVAVGCGGDDYQAYSDDGSYVFDANQPMTTVTNYTAEQLEAILPDYFKGYGATFVEGETTYGVNALFLIALCDYESNGATAENATEEFKNYAGIKAVGIYRGFESYEAGIVYAAKWVSEKYLNEKGKYYNGGTSIKKLSEVWASARAQGSTAFVENITALMQGYYDAIKG